VLLEKHVDMSLTKFSKKTQKHNIFVAKIIPGPKYSFDLI
jgi:hypothetical protein